MARLFTKLPLSYAPLSEGYRYGSASAVHEPSPADLPHRSSSPAPTRSSVRPTPPRRSRTSPALRVRLHLKPGQKGTKHLVVAESDWEPRFAPDEIVALRVAFTDVATRNRVKQAGGAWNPDRTGVAAALRPRRRPRPETSHRHPAASRPGCRRGEREASRCRCRPGIHIEMPVSSSGCPASTGRCDDVVGRAVEY
jgi:hypothetical protein